MLDKSSVYVLAERMYFFGQKYPIEFQLYGLSFHCLSEVVQIHHVISET